LRRLTARMAQKPAIESGVIGASADPAMTTSASPRRINSSPSAMASPPVAHARTGHWLGPVAPSMMASCPAAMFGTIIVMRNGLTLPGPRSCRTRYSRSQVERPPMPLPITMATRSGSSRMMSATPALSTACTPAAIPNWAKRSILRDCFLLIKSVGSKSEHSPAMREGYGEGSKRVISPIPLFPCSEASQKFATPIPRGVTAPAPVMSALPLPLEAGSVTRLGAPSRTRRPRRPW
jgi:hypothetical protein